MAYSDSFQKMDKLMTKYDKTFFKSVRPVEWRIGTWIKVEDDLFPVILEFVVDQVNTLIMSSRSRASTLKIQDGSHDLTLKWFSRFQDKMFWNIVFELLSREIRTLVVFDFEFLFRQELRMSIVQDMQGVSTYREIVWLFPT